jgi:very-short-patch-repair endonuclease/DNA polymerase III delta prime subunit
MKRVTQRVEEWKRKIVDLSRRNRSLYFARTRGSTLKLVEPSLQETFERLVNSEKPWKFYMPPDAPETPDESGSENAEPSLIRAPQSAHLEDTEFEIPADRHADELVTDCEDGTKLRRILRNMYRRSRTDFEERGVRILFLGFGMLEWKEVDQSEIIKSPILLVPTELRRESVNDPFVLCPVDEESVVNPSLAVKLGDDFKIELPPIPDDWDSMSFENFLAGFQDQIAKYDWGIKSQCWLGLFSFHKLVIYEDLKTHGQLLGDHSVVRRLCEEEQEAVIHEPPDPYELDKKTAPDTSFLVADADSSQLVCIEAVKAGSDLVIQGPPGTGKSQTITNLISEFIARGKSVLFVSEKMAALEVVYQRLQKASLGHFCLQLHSHRANKREVVQQLYKTYTEQLQPKKGLTDFEARQLVERRKKLNEYVNSLHLVRSTLGYSPFDGLGWVAQLEAVPYVAAGDFDASRLAPESLDAAGQLANRLQPLWQVAVGGKDFPWFGCALTSFTLAIKAELKESLGECIASVGALRQDAGQAAQRLGLDGPARVSTAEWLLRTTRLLQVCPGIEKKWLLGADLSEITSETERYRVLSKTYDNDRGIVDSLYNADYWLLTSNVCASLRQSLEKLSSCVKHSLLGDETFIVNRNLLVAWAQDFSARLEQWAKDGDSIQQCLGIHGSLNLKRVGQFVRIAQLCESEDRPDETWFEITKLREVVQHLPSIRENFEQRNRDRRSLFADYEAGILDLDISALIEKFSGPYSSVFRVFRPAYYKSKRRVRRFRKDGRLPASIAVDLRKLQALKDFEAQLVKEFPRSKELLGAHFQGFETDFARVGRAVACAQELVQLAGVQPLPGQFVRQASAQGLATLNLRAGARRLKESIDEWEKKLPPVKEYLPRDFWDGSGLPLDEQELADLKLWSAHLVDAAESVRDLIEPILACARSPDGFTCKRMIDDLERLGELRAIDAEIAAESAHLRETFGQRFSGIETSWDQVLVAVQWTVQFKDHMGTTRVPENLLNIVVAGNKDAVPDEALANDVTRFHSGFLELSRSFSKGFPAMDGTPLSDADFVAIVERLRGMVEQIDALRDWIDFKAVEENFHEQGLSQLFSNLLSKASSLRAPEVPNAIRRSLLQAWLTWVFADDPCLGTFRGENHEQLISEFRELDKKQWQEGVHSVVREINRLRPSSSVVIPGGELQVLLKEAHKQRRHLPLRKLFGMIPNLLLQLKPCLLMSPISVSQFLDPGRTKFDLVIFDEASQLRSEDAICSVYRGKQLVVCGDNKQLPPTTFFDQGMSDDLSDETDDPNALEAFDPFSSVLDACAAVMPQRQLKWHYRSEHESLIAFSNCTFYDYSLITFPSWLQEDEGLGVKFLHVADGVYDRGGRRDNVREAEEVVSLVEEHLRKRPDQSLGVVTFSMAQAETIENHLEQFRRQNPELERYFATDRPERFFVKNLESVQGDERDVLIFSVGYGRDKFGRLTMNFGPVNGTGGERRLNVAVTRARKKIVVVSSIRASDFDLGAINNEGVRVLQRYLDFAERGQDALALQTGGGEFESPLEQSVAARIRTLGFGVVPQVGCSSFRVDLGVVDPSHPGTFILGVECDGASYHSSATARDRDRIRQQILEKLGWKIHRIWSPDWVTRNETEVDRLKAAIENARRGRLENAHTEPSTVSNGPSLWNAPLVVEKEIPVVDDKFVTPEWVKVYVVCKPRGQIRGLQFHDLDSLPLLKRMLFQIVESEGPVHKDVAATRLAKAWELDRVGERMMTAVKSAWRSLSREKLLRIQGHFLWPAAESFQVIVRQPDPDDNQSRRSVEEIPSEEIVLAMRNLTRDSLSIERDKLLLYVARIFGFERAGNHIQKALEGAFEELVETRQLLFLEDRVSLPS